MQMSTGPGCAPDHSIKRNELSRVKTGKASNINFFSLPLHIIFSPVQFPPPYLSTDSPRQKDKLPSGLLF